MSILENLGRLIKESAEPKIRGVSKEDAEMYIDLIGRDDGYGWNRFKAEVLYEKMKSNHGSEIDMETLSLVAKFNYPDNAINYLPILLIFSFFFGMLGIVVF
ncbi:MAG: hypothetical protein MN733_27980 [Nitrososphaera sp.]|nr:hypothetical protein [Nitrososphaera sp.]